MPQRLVYSPKAYVYTKDVNDVIHNVSSYVVGGRVDRLINQVSTAEIILRNPNKIFTNPSVGVAFHPMDPITIYLERVEGHPVQVFTGFLNETPYYQMFPGTIKLTASCTLKRLLYTYFDPALPFFRTFMERFGWFMSEDGTVVNAKALQEHEGIGHLGSEDAPNLVPFGGSEKEKRTTAGNDSSLGHLLWALIYYVAQIRNENIYIEFLPGKISEIVTRIFNNFRRGQQQSKKELTELEDFLRTYIGTSSQGTGGAGGETSGKKLGEPTDTKTVVQTMTQIADNIHVPPAFVLNTAYNESGFDPNAKEGGKELSFGWFQFNFQGGERSTPYSSSSKSYTKAEARDIGISTTAFCNAAKAKLHEHPDWIQESQWEVWAKETQVSVGYPHWSETMPKIQEWISKYGKGTTIEGLESSGGTRVELEAEERHRKQQKEPGKEKEGEGSLDLGVYHNPFEKASHVVPSRIDEGVDYTCNVGAKIVAIGDGVVTSIKGGFANQEIMAYQLSSGPLAGQYIYYSEGINPIKKQGDKVKAGEPIAVTNSQPTGLEFGYARADGWPHALDAYAGVPDGTPMPEGLMFDRLMRKLGVPGSNDPSSGNGPLFPGGHNELVEGSSEGGEIGASDPLVDAKAAAFNSSIVFPTVLESVAAKVLKGQRALMNDVSLLPFVQQVAEASLRSFMSLPNGDFYAFYPDYFGELGHNKPYWYIYDVEILNGGINLTDDNLATHVFCVGDTIWPVNEKLLNEIVSKGVVNIFNAFSGEAVDRSKQKADTEPAPFGPNTGNNLAQAMSIDEAKRFLERYGARPVVLDMPMIRSHLYEMLMAYQGFNLAWSRQFLTPFEFTFMPELYPGGKVGFPDHGIQMYVESVSHAWDNETGYSTEAKLSAPALLGNESSANNNNLPPDMVNALVEPIRGHTKASNEKGVRTKTPPKEKLPLTKTGQLH